MQFHKISFSRFSHQEFDEFLKESTNVIRKLYETYRNLYLSILNEETTAIVPVGEPYNKHELDAVSNQANRHIKDKVNKFVRKLVDWVVEFVRKTNEFIQNISMSNKEFLKRVKPVVENKMSSDLKNNVKMETRTYDPDFIDLNRFGVINALIERKFAEGNDDELIDRFGDMYVDKIKITMANTVVRNKLNEENNWEEYKTELRNYMMGEKVERNFDMRQFNIIERFTTGEDRKIIDTINRFSRIIKVAAASLTAQTVIIRLMPVDSKDKAKKQVTLDSTIVKQKILSCYAEVMTTMANIKLMVLKAQLNDARLFCLKAYNYRSNSVIKENVLMDSLFEPDTFNLDILNFTEN